MKPRSAAFCVILTESEQGYADAVNIYDNFFTPILLSGKAAVMIIIGSSGK